MTQGWQRGKYILSDFLTASSAWVIFNIIRFEEHAVYYGYSSLESYLTSSIVREGQILVPCFWIFLYWLSGYYNKPYGKSRLGEFSTTFITVSIGVTVLFFGIVLNDLPLSYQIYYKLFFSLYALQFCLTYIVRLWITQDCLNKIKSGKYALKILIIGCGHKAQQIAGELKKQGYAICGFIRTELDSRTVIPASEVQGSWTSLDICIQKFAVDELVIALDITNDQQLIEKLYSLYHYKIPIKVLLSESHPLTRGQLKTIYGSPLVDVTDNNFSETGKNIKWLMDKVLSVLALLLLSPLFLYISLRVKRDSDGPVFFRQERIGYRGKPFQIYKFRTMYIDAEDSGPSLSKENDPRITSFGHTMRKFRMDELPQFWNVLKGDMSIVGPRPERRFFIDRIVRLAPYYYLLHNVRPGITSLGMVKYGYASTIDQMVERLRYDILYYENMSLTLDITILIYTIKTVFTGKGI